MSKNMRLSTCLCHPKKNPSISKQLAFLSFASKRRQNLSLQRSRSMLELLALNWFDVLVSVIIYVCGINSTFLINWIMDFSLNLPPVLSPIALTQSQLFTCAYCIQWIERISLTIYSWTAHMVDVRVKSKLPHAQARLLRCSLWHVCWNCLRALCRAAESF